MTTSLPTRAQPHYTPGGSPVRHGLAALLRLASRGLTRLSRSLSTSERATEREHVGAL